MAALMNALRTPRADAERRPVRLTLDRVLELLDAAPVTTVVSASVDAEAGRVRVELEAPRRAAERDAIGAGVGALLLAQPGVTSVSIAFLSLDLAGCWADAEN